MVDRIAKRGCAVPEPGKQYDNTFALMHSVLIHTPGTVVLLTIIVGLDARRSSESALERSSIRGLICDIAMFFAVTVSCPKIDF